MKSCHISLCACWVRPFLAADNRIYHLGLGKGLYEKIVVREDQGNVLKAQLAGSVLKARPLVGLMRWQLHTLLPVTHSAQLLELALTFKASVIISTAETYPQSLGLLPNQPSMSISDSWNLGHMPISSCEESWEM